MPFTIAGCPLEFEDYGVLIETLEPGDIFEHDGDVLEYQTYWLGQAQCNYVNKAGREHINFGKRVYRAIPMTAIPPAPRTPSDRWERRNDTTWVLGEGLFGDEMSVVRDDNGFVPHWGNEDAYVGDKPQRFGTMGEAMIVAEDAYVAHCREKLAKALEITGGA